MKHDFDNKAQLQIPHQPHLKLHIRRDKEDPQQFQNLKFNKLAHNLTTSLFAIRIDLISQIIISKE